MKLVLLVALASLAVTGRAVHSSVICETPPPLCEAASRATLVFFGEVLYQTSYAEYTEGGPSTNGVQAVQFNIIQEFKGLTPGQWSGFFYTNVEARPFKKDARYLVFASRSATGALHHGCTLTREIEKREEESWMRTGAVELAECFKTQK